MLSGVAESGQKSSYFRGDVNGGPNTSGNQCRFSRDADESVSNRIIQEVVAGRRTVPHTPADNPVRTTARAATAVGAVLIET